MFTCGEKLLAISSQDIEIESRLVIRRVAKGCNDLKMTFQGDQTPVNVI